MKMNTSVLAMGLSPIELHTLEVVLPRSFPLKAVTAEMFTQKMAKQAIDIYNTARCIIINPEVIAKFPSLDDFRAIPVMLLSALLSEDRRKDFLPPVTDLKGKPDLNLRKVIDMLEHGNKLPWLNMKNQPDRLWHDDLWLLDIETNGVDCLENDIIAFRLAHMSAFEINEELTILVRPRQPLTSGVEKLTGISNADMTKAIPLAEALECLECITESVPVIISEWNFTLPFLKSAFYKAEKDFNLPCLLLDRLEALLFGYTLQKQPDRLLKALNISLKNGCCNLHLNKLHTLTEETFRQLEKSYNVRSLAELYSFYGAEEFI